MAAPTAAQVIAALSIKNTFTILNLTAPYNTGQYQDITNYSGLSLLTANGDTVKVVTQILDPVGGSCYENAGYAAGTFASPDSSLTSLTAAAFTLNTYTGTNTPIYGKYTFNLKVEVHYHGTSAYIVTKSFDIYLNQDLQPTLSLEETPNCAAAIYTSVDTTSYGAPSGYSLQTIVRTHKVRPPLVSLQSDGVTPQSTVTADAQTVVLASTGNPLWTGGYSASLSVILTYVDTSGNITIVKVPVIEADVIVDCDNNYCKMQCCLNTLIKKYNTYKGVNTKEATLAFDQWEKGTMWFFAVQQANLCSNASLAQTYIANFWLDTGCDPNCDCGCTDQPSPVVPTTIINGTNGAPGAPGATGATGAAGAAGADGAAGANGVAVLANQYPALSTLGVAFESLLVGRTPYVLTANTLNTDLDEITIHVSFSTSSWTSITQLVKLVFNGSAMNVGLNNSFYSSNINKITIDARLTRASNTTAKYEVVTTFYSVNIGGSILARQHYQDIVALAGLNFTTTAYNIDAQGDSAVIGDITCNAFEVVYKHKV